MNLKRGGSILLTALALTTIIFIIEVNIHNDTNFTKGELNEVLLWSFIRGFVISIAVSIGNHFSFRKKNKKY